MKVVRLSSGIGNQLFMYAFYCHIKEKYKNEDIFFDDKYYKRDEFGRKVELSLLFPEYPICRFSFNPAGESRVFRFLYKWKQKIFPTFNFVSESEYDCDKYYEGDTYFNGYWQTDKYVNNCSTSLFTPKGIFPIELKSIYDKIINSRNSVCIHFRRTDYFSPKYIKRYGVCGEKYYNNAMKLIESKISNPYYFVFSDDIEWVKNNISFNNKFDIVPNYDINPFWYIYLMSLCHHNIISNSTFSWWGAYLGKHNNGVVIAPNVWTFDSKETIALNEWIKINI